MRTGSFFAGSGPETMLAINYFENGEYRIGYFHIDQIRSKINVAYGKKAAPNWEDYVTYFKLK